ncbi:MAG TPA: cold shock domain-containing protein [Vicinamibacterales bacterium]|nr:cold shock domain-containing protein [Vicinamibacterales bacterium]
MIPVESRNPWDVWCHFSAIEGDGFRTLTAGERVEVEYVRANQESFKYLAVRVRRLGTFGPEK